MARKSATYDLSPGQLHTDALRERTKDCDPHNLAESGESGKNQCIIDITGALSSASIASTLISLNVINCPGTLQFSDALQQRLCAASILNIVTVSSYMTTSFATLGNICGCLGLDSGFGDPESASMLLNGAEVEDDGTKEPGAPSGSRRVLMASGEPCLHLGQQALTLAFACGALAVAMVLGKDTPAAAAQQPFIGPLPPMPRDEEDSWVWS
eukprot:s110_g15.t1